MKTITVLVDQQDINEVQRAGFEVDGRRGVIDRYLEKHMNDVDESAINSKPFIHFMSLLCESEAHYELAKQRLEENYIPDFLKGHSYNWNLDYATKEMTITVLCDCAIDGVE